MELKKFNTLFLDRDGVINVRIPGGYVAKPEEFQFLEGVLEAIPLLNAIFDRILIVTNQQGIGKGLMTSEDLEEVHRRMVEEISEAGGRIEKIYFCPDLADKQPNCRKPAPAMALQAKSEYPEIDFQHSWMVGDSLSDLEFGWNSRMHTALIETNPEEVTKAQHLLRQHQQLPCQRFSSLLELASVLNSGD